MNSQELLPAMNRASAALQWSAITEAEVFTAVRKQIAGLGLRGSIAILEEDGAYLVYRAIAYPGDQLSVMEKITGARAQGMRIPLATVSEYRTAVETKTPVFFPDNSKLIIQFLPAFLRPFLGMILPAFGSRPGISAPLVANGRVLGLLGMVGKGLTPEHIPFAEAFANHVAIALDNARLYESMQKTERELMLATAVAEKASHAKSEFLTIISHELRTPLTSIIGFAELLHEDQERLPPFAREKMGTILHNALHLREMINGVLDLAGLTYGQAAVSRQAVDVRVLVEGLLTSLPVLLKGKPLKLRQAVAPDLPLVQTDPTLVKQILYNLMGNAIKFTEKGEIILEAGLEKSTPPRLTFRVRDTGIGIPADKLDMIFEPFQQADEGTNRKYGGSGIGLSLSRGLAEKMGGAITVESAVGRGSVFTVSLPCAITPAGHPA